MEIAPLLLGEVEVLEVVAGGLRSVLVEPAPVVAEGVEETVKVVEPEVAELAVEEPEPSLMVN